VRLPSGASSADAYDRLLERGLYVLPCDPFYWDSPAKGASFIRVSLARDPGVIAAACAPLADGLHELFRAAGQLAQMTGRP
jgi:DNA-binding transcriptional MocR family regulator